MSDEDLILSAKTWDKTFNEVFKDGFREGVDQGKDKSFQGGFDMGYKNGLLNAFKMGYLNAVTRTMGQMETMKSIVNTGEIEACQYSEPYKGDCILCPVSETGKKISRKEIAEAAEKYDNNDLSEIITEQTLSIEQQKLKKQEAYRKLLESIGQEDHFSIIHSN